MDRTHRAVAKGQQVSDTDEQSAPDVTPPEATGTPRTREQARSAILVDKRISRGAMHLWLLLRDHLNWKTGECNPGVRRLVKLMRCNKDSIQGWSAELHAAGWLDWKQTKNRTGSHQGVSHQYTILDGCGFEYLKAGRVPSTRDTSVPRRRGTLNKGHSVPSTRDTVSPPLGTKPSSPLSEGEGRGSKVVVDESQIVGSPSALASAPAARAERADLDFVTLPFKADL